MALVAHTDLPAFARLRDEGFDVIPGSHADATGVRTVHIGLLNLMPDAALEATERQFLRLLSAGRKMAYVHVHVFSVDGLDRQGSAAHHVENHYEDFERLKREGLDALVITGANPANPVLSGEGFWDGMLEVIDWARDHVSSTVCSCLATHAVVEHGHGVKRIKLPHKRWGVYEHRIVADGHPLLRRVNTRFDAPHSHVYEVTEAQLESVGAQTLALSEEAGVHLAVSGDGLRFVFFQGHPEYDINSLLKEYKREVSRFANGTYEEYPRFPEHYFTGAALSILTRFRDELSATNDRAAVFAQFPEVELVSKLENTWTDTGMAMFANWLDLVYDLAPPERTSLYRDGIDPADPLGLNRA